METIWISTSEVARIADSQASRLGTPPEDHELRFGRIVWWQLSLREHHLSSISYPG
jgi:hypothetical protein